MERGLADFDYFDGISLILSAPTAFFFLFESSF